jgi:hypothetical protein
MKTIISLFLFLLFTTNSFASGATVKGNLTVTNDTSDAVIFLNGNSLTTVNGLLKNRLTWSGATNYSAGDVVQYNGSSYVATGASFGSNPLSGNWLALASPGNNGLSATLTSESAGVNCTYGGSKVQVGSGTPTYVCNGTPGTPGAPGPIGPSLSYLTLTCNSSNICVCPSNYELLSGGATCAATQEYLWKSEYINNGTQWEAICHNALGTAGAAPTVTIKCSTASAVAGQYIIFGKVTGTGNVGVTMDLSLSGAPAGQTTTDANGDFTFSGLASGNYTVTPSKSGYTFSSLNLTYPTLSGNVTNANFTLTPIPPYITALVLLTQGGSLGFTGQVEVFTNSTDHISIDNATVTINGITLGYDIQNTQYSTNLSLGTLGGPVTLNVAVGGTTYTATGTHYSAVPSITSPATGSASSPYNITWTGGTPTNGAGYVAGIMGNSGFVFPAPVGNNGGPANLSISTYSYNVPANSLIAGTYQVMVGIGTPGMGNQVAGTGISIPGAATGSAIWLGAATLSSLTLN